MTPGGGPAPFFCLAGTTDQAVRLFRTREELHAHGDNVD